MNNPNPFIPQATLQDQKNKKRARVKVAVLSIFAFNILLICPLLIQGCKDKQPAQTDSSVPASTDTASTTNDTNVAPAVQPPTNAVTQPPVVQQTPVAPPPPPPAPLATSTDYVIVKGDSYSKIAHDHGITVKALEGANPGVDPMKLQIGKKIQIPPASGAASPAATASISDSADVYVVKSGDSLSKIAHDHTTTVKALRAANDLKTDKIKVGQKLKLPGSSAAPAVAPAAAPADTSPSSSGTASNVPSVPTPAPAPGTAH